MENRNPSVDYLSRRLLRHSNLNLNLQFQLSLPNGNIYCRSSSRIIDRIMAIGCEEIPIPNRYSIARRLKQFAVTASLVCRDWHALVNSPSSYHLWHTQANLLYYAPYSQDIAKDFTRFAEVLSGSRLSDLDLFLGFPLGEEEDMLAERLMLHALSLLAPYRRQIRSLRIESRPLLALPSILSSLTPFPRLASFYLEFFSDPERLVVSPHDDFSFGQPTPVLDLSLDDNCQEVTLVNCGFRGEIIFPSSTSTLSLSCFGGSSITWNSIARHLNTQSHLVSLSLDPVTLMDVAMASSNPRSGEVCHLQSLRVLTLSSDIVSTYTLMKLLSVPSLATLRLTISSPKLGASGDAILTPVYPPKLLSMRSLHLSLRTACWSIIHDRFVQAIISSRLEFVEISLNMVAVECSPLSPLSTPFIVSDLRLHIHWPQLDWVAILSRWNPEIIAIHHGTIHSRVFPRFISLDADTLSMPKLRALSFHHTTVNDLNIFLSRLSAPQLREIELIAPTKLNSDR